MPFHQDATCTIRPEGLIAENYVDCDPGTPGSPPLQGSGGHPPTVPVTHTTEPVSLLDLFNIFNLPTRERFQVIIDELGIGTAGRGADFNDDPAAGQPGAGPGPPGDRDPGPPEGPARHDRRCHRARSRPRAPATPQALQTLP